MSTKLKLAALSFGLAAAAVFAQEFRATISGYVFDASGGGVPNAKIQVVNVATNETTNVTTEASGAYTVPFLRPGQYKLTVTAEGFKQYVRENLTLQVGQIAGVNVNLEVGAVSDSISVTAEAALLETQTASRVGVVNTTQVSEMPLNSRNPFMLGSMMSGVTFRGAAIWQRPFDNGAIAEWSVNGGRQSNNEFLMDGAPNNGQMGNNNIAYVPIVDAVQEFSVQQNSYDAQYGHTGGGVFNVVLKSGTNDFHATGWEFARRKWMDANTFQNNAVPASASNPSGGTPRPAHALDQYGFQLEGPVLIPKLLKRDGAVRLFYLGSFENYREDWPQIPLNSFPEAEMRNGDFSKLTDPQGRLVTIHDPFNPTFAANGDPIRAAFPNNTIPASRIHPVAKAVTGFMPLPNNVQAGERYARNNHRLPEYAAQDKFYNLILKFDWNFGDRHRAFVRHASNDRTEDRCINGICAGPGMDGQQPFQRINDAYVLDWISTLSPTFVLNIRASHNRFIEKGFGRDNVDFDLTKLGLPQSLLSSLPGPVMFGRWNFYNGRSGTTNHYSPLGRGQSNNFTNNYNLSANATKIYNNHTMKFGIDWRRIHFIQQNSGDILQFNSRPIYTGAQWNQDQATAGDAYASFLLGAIEGSSNYPVYPFFQQWYFAPYFQDDWRINRRLSLNLGLRWDWNPAPSEKYNRINRGFNPSIANPIASQIPADMLALYPNLRNLTGGLEFAGVNGLPETVSKNVWTNWQPRVGVAYQLKDRLVLRGGYGLYFLNPNNNYLETIGFSTNTPLVHSLDDGRTLASTNLLGNPYPTGINLPVGSSLGAATFAGQNYNWFNGRDFTTPYVHQFSLGFQYQLTQGSTIEASYVGSRSLNLNTEKDFNLPSLNFRRQCNLLEGGSPAFCNQLLPNPFRGVEAFRGTGFFTAATLPRWQLNRPFPQFNGNLQERGRNDSKIWYNSMQLNYNVRMGRSLTLLANYTLSKMMERWGWTDPVADVMQQGLYFNDRPHFFKFSAVYELPFGRGKSFGKNAGGFLNKLIDGWQMSTFTTMSSGEPNNLPGNAILLKDPRTPGGDWNGTVDWKKHQVQGWNPCVLRQNTDGTVVPQQFSLNRGCGTDLNNYAWLFVSQYAPGGGDMPGRHLPSRSGQIRKQRLWNVDASLAKMTSITERLKMQFRLEAFNLTNYYFYGRDSGFNDNANDANFGTIIPNTAWIGNGYPRQLQLGFKVLW